MISPDNQIEIKNADERIIKLSEVQPSFYQTCHHTDPIPALFSGMIFIKAAVSIGDSLSARGCNQRYRQRFARKRRPALRLLRIIPLNFQVRTALKLFQ